jgi:hypothetical protein
MERIVESKMVGPSKLRTSVEGRKELYSEIEIDSPPERVWTILSDFAGFPNWNPFMRIAGGELKKDSKLTVHLQPSGARGMTFKPTVLKVERERELRWIGHFVVPGLFDGEHVLELHSVEGGRRTRFVQRELFSGILLLFLTKMLNNDTSRGFAEMNEALKLRAEQKRESMFPSP